MSSDGRAFFQNVHADNISSTGAQLSGIEYRLAAGDTIGVQYEDKKARFRVVWAIEAGPLHKIQAGVQMLDGQVCPWLEVVTAAPAPEGPTPGARARSGDNKRRFVRHKIRFPLELRTERSNTSMQTSATDISGRGCYVETLLPLPFGTSVNVSFWMESEKITTTGFVRASDPGVGMGIEFTGLDPATQERFQQLVEGLDPGFAGLGSTPPPDPTEA